MAEQPSSVSSLGGSDPRRFPASRHLQTRFMEKTRGGVRFVLTAGTPPPPSGCSCVVTFTQTLNSEQETQNRRSESPSVCLTKEMDYSK